MIIEYKVIMKDIIREEKKMSLCWTCACSFEQQWVFCPPNLLTSLCPHLGPLLMVWNKFFEAQISAHHHTLWGIHPITSHSSLSPLPCSVPLPLCFSLLVLIPFGCVSCTCSQFLPQGPFCHADSTVCVPTTPVVLCRPDTWWRIPICRCHCIHQLHSIPKPILICNNQYQHAEPYAPLTTIYIW